MGKRTYKTLKPCVIVYDTIPTLKERLSLLWYIFFFLFWGWEFGINIDMVILTIDVLESQEEWQKGVSGQIDLLRSVCHSNLPLQNPWKVMSFTLTRDTPWNDCLRKIKFNHFLCFIRFIWSNHKLFFDEFLRVCEILEEFSV